MAGQVDAKSPPSKPTFGQWCTFLWSFFLDGFVFGFLRHLPLVLMVALPLWIICLDGLLPMGLPLLFWHQDWPRQIFAGVSVALLLAIALFEGYLLDGRRADRPWLRRIPPQLFLRPRRTLGQSFKRSKSRGIAPPPPPLPSPTAAPLRPLVEASCCMSAGAVTIGVIAVLLFSVYHLWPGDTACALEPLAPAQRIWLPLGVLIGIAIAWLVLALMFDVIDGMASATPLNQNWHARAVHWIGDRLSRLLPDARETRRGGDDDSDDTIQAWRRLQVLSIFTGIIVAIVYLTNVVVVVSSRWHGWITPASALCTLLSVLAAAYGLAAMRTPTVNGVYWSALWSNATGLIFVAVILMALGGTAQHKVRFESFAGYYEAPVSRYPDPAGPAIALMDPDDLLTAQRDGPAKAGPLVIVCASGGGIRAATWTAALLGRIEKRAPGFAAHVRLMCGASGGMLGCAGYATSFVPPRQAGSPSPGHSAEPSSASPPPLDGDQLALRLAQDSLSVTVKRLIFADIPCLAWPGARTAGQDRGGAMEREWRDNLGPGFADATFPSQLPGERDGWRPSLVFSPMIVEDGRRVLISNLDLDEAVATSGGDQLGGDKHLYSRSAYEFAWMFPRAFEQFHVSTAARMSASFPYVSPAGVLPTHDRRRVVDAGYYDNYGVTVAAGVVEYLLGEHPGDGLKEYCSGVIVIQVRDSVDDLERDHVEFDKPPPVNPSPLGRGTEWLTTPPEGFMAARTSVSLFRNDHMLQRLTRLFDERGFPKSFFTTVTFNYCGGTLTWYLTDKQKADILGAAATAAGDAYPNYPRHEIDEPNRARMKAFEEWWQAHARGSARNDQPRRK